MGRTVVRLLKRKKQIVVTCRIDAARRKKYATAARAEYEAGDREGSRSLSLWMRKHLDKAAGHVEPS